MRASVDDFRRHFESLSDEALLAVNPDDLVPDALFCFGDEVSRRGLRLETPEEAEARAASSDTDNGPAPDWLEEAAVACSYDSYPGRSAAGEITTARTVLEQAGIPCYITMEEATERRPQPWYVHDLMVPGHLQLEARSVLDVEIFNPELEVTWCKHFSGLSDEELGQIDPQVIVAGLQDQIERLTRAYNDEVARRQRPEDYEVASE